MDTMDKVLIDLYVPSLNEHYDVYLPISRKIYEVEKLLSKMIEELSYERYKNSESVLCYYDTGKIINSNLRIIDCEIATGTRLMLL